VCTDIGGVCVTEQDGYYYVSAICIFLIVPTARKLEGAFIALHCSLEQSADSRMLEALPLAKWRVTSAK
jgi:hypothetical protein